MRKSDHTTAHLHSIPFSLAIRPGTMIPRRHLVLLAASLATTCAFVPSHVAAPLPSTSRSSQLNVIPAAAASLLAGSVAGALGVGVAHPIDTVKTKSQVLAASQTEMTTKTAAKVLQKKKQSSNDNDSENKSDSSKPLVDFGTDQMDLTVDSTGRLSIASAIPVPTAGASMMEVSQYIYQTAGIPGFFAGVSTSMLGQAIIKAVVFAVNAAVLQYSREHHLFGDHTALQLLSAAALAGFVTSFLAAPVDRIKVLMQCADHECYNGDETECVDAVLQREGWKGLLGRGLFVTMIREVPAYSLYFGVYGGLQAYCTDLSALLGPTLTPALYGAAAGCACWLPIYPIDVIRTAALNTEGDDADSTDISKSPWEIAVDLYQTAGWEPFYDGLGARMLRQAVNHAVTFSVYEIMMKAALFQQPDVFA
ncbi:Mitochondrial basic amino acids transporter [Seminavis robusta]|uniref:Mitochondrial basic amino acids transporter n=1 Tax=Seminavis robusta TaxID=568900 RepID=A0A9N8E5C7_9STRA|nr:Mitochondrial basic amino acids transporter [Seminavis robusta]|eukprot:Sro668_g184360.1 Mitochondrial basic amino acids transporter (422) ;mRNA; f:32863-34128